MIGWMAVNRDISDGCRGLPLHRVTYEPKTVLPKSGGMADQSPTKETAFAPPRDVSVRG